MAAVNRRATLLARLVIFLFWQFYARDGDRSLRRPLQLVFNITETTTIEWSVLYPGKISVFVTNVVIPWLNKNKSCLKCSSGFLCLHVNLRSSECIPLHIFVKSKFEQISFILRTDLAWFVQEFWFRNSASWDTFWSHQSPESLNRVSIWSNRIFLDRPIGPDRAVFWHFNYIVYQLRWDDSAH